MIGIDEVGRGALAGPVLVCALGARRQWADALPPMKDSKQLTARGREKWYLKICEWRAAGLIFFATASVNSNVIDQIGIERALKRAVRRSLESKTVPRRNVEVLLDGRLKAPDRFRQRSIIRGDETVPLIALASIVAKVTRDRIVRDADDICSGYDFAAHKGYGTALHFTRLARLGMSPLHRKSFLKHRNPITGTLLYQRGV